ncbi:RNA 2'-phosphotransferase [compost metagenome]
MAVPPDVLFHGTPARNVASILDSGLNSGVRHYVHMSQDTMTAEAVGLRGTTKAAILRIDTEQMKKDGLFFYLAENGVWLVEGVIDAKYIKVLDYRDK